MKTVNWLVALGLTFTLFSSVSEAQFSPINGTLKPGYGSAIATQVLGTTANDGVENNIGLPGPSDGSELDAAYGVVSNGVLHLFFAGALNTGASPGTLCTNAACSTFDKLSVFIMADNGVGGANTLGTNYSTLADSGGINRMGVGGNSQDPGSAGLTFDTGFNANYWIGVGVGNTNAQYQVTMYVNYEVICPGCTGAYLGNAIPTNATLDVNGADNNHLNTGISVALNNSATNGVWGDINGCPVVNGCPTNCPQDVTTGVEMAIPLSAIGSPQNSVSVCAFLTTSTYNQLYNQVLSPVWNGTSASSSACEFDLSADASETDFQTLPPAPTGQHYFTISVPPCNSIQASPPSATFPATGGVSSETVTESGSCSWTVSTSANWITITSGASGSGNGSFTYSVSANSSIGPQTATIVVAGPVATQAVSVVEDGLPLPITVDGTVDPAYGCPLAVQQIGTSYGKNFNTNSILGAGGSELDAAYGLVENDILYLFLAGNIQDNGNRVMIFFMTGPGGTNTLVSGQVTNLDVVSGRSVLSWMGPTNSVPNVSGPGPGLTFDPGFAPNYFMDVWASATAVTFNYAQLWPGGTNASGIATNGYTLGSNGGTNNVLTGGTNPYLIQATINNSNVGGIDAGNSHNGCYTNAEGVAEDIAAATVTNGIEMAIPLAAFGSPTGQIAVAAFIANNTGVQFSNQALGPFWDGTTNYCLTGPGRSTNTWAAFLNLGDFPGQHYFYVGPEMRVTSVAVASNKNVNISFLTENNTNLTYQVQRATVLTTNTTWSNVGSLNVGSGSILTVTDNSGGTNKPGAFYRVRQAPNCTP